MTLLALITTGVHLIVAAVVAVIQGAAPPFPRTLPVVAALIVQIGTTICWALLTPAGAAWWLLVPLAALTGALVGGLLVVVVRSSRRL